MLITTPTIFLGKKNFDAYLFSLPSKDEELSAERKVDLALKAFELYNKGIPYNCRPACLYFFYHYYPADYKEIKPDHLEEWNILNYYADRSLRDKKILSYLEQLEPEKFFEVFQIRGRIESYNSGLEDYLEMLPNLEWEKIQDRILQFIDNEPVCSNYLLGKLFLGLSRYYYDNNIKTSVRYKIAQRIWQCSTDIEILRSAWLCLNNPEDIFEYKKSTLPENEVVKLLRLEKLEKEIMDSFDESKLELFHRRMYIRLFADDISLIWLRLIDDILSIFKNDTYVRGYAEFLRGYVCYASGHLTRACKEFLRSNSHHYNPVIVLMYIVEVYETLNKYNIAVEYAQQIIKMMGASKDDLIKEECFQKILKILKHTMTEPVLVNSLIAEKAEENEHKRKRMISSFITASVESKKINILEKRMKRGIKLFDAIIDPNRTNSLFHVPEKLEEIFVSIPIAEIESLGLEEIELFNYHIENNDGYITSEIPFSTLISFNTYIIKRRLERISGGVKQLIGEFPNSLACIFIAKEIIKEMILKGNIYDAIQIIYYLSSRLGNYRIPGYYKIIEPVQSFLQSHEKFQEEITLISIVKSILHNDDLEKANNDLANAEERLNKKTYTAKIKSIIMSFTNQGRLIQNQ